MVIDKKNVIQNHCLAATILNLMGFITKVKKYTSPRAKSCCCFWLQHSFIAWPNQLLSNSMTTSSFSFSQEVLGIILQQLQQICKFSKRILVSVTPFKMYVLNEEKCTKIKLLFIMLVER